MDPREPLIPPATLPDLLAPGLRLISVGLNPSPASVAAQVYFAHPRNRFWPMLDASGLIDETLSPSPDSMRRLFEAHRIGFTDLVKRPTAGVAQLRAADYRAGASALRMRLHGLAPRAIWFQGRTPWAQYLRHAEGSSADGDWGLQTQSIDGVPVWVTPNPSPANAAYSLPELIRQLAELATWLRLGA
ncbi:mismatch-specific DNA-glycosylase [Acidihalobacter aeolianus]|uniref:mismatch-specific DNA-glycosylase n=1 Tax=Acidihalobacter aeolianus TaxID=2792603 RepID=UPI0018D46434|nr:mismatch-specific DNA-glycosylase [Acidihalobacter aeolianus]